MASRHHTSNWVHYCFVMKEWQLWTQKVLKTFQFTVTLEILSSLLRSMYCSTTSHLELKKIHIHRLLINTHTLKFSKLWLWKGLFRPVLKIQSYIVNPLNSSLLYVCQIPVCRTTKHQVKNIKIKSDQFHDIRRFLHSVLSPSLLCRSLSKQRVMIFNE